MEEIIKKMCPKHGITDFVYSKTENRYRCKECRKDAVIDKRRRNKIELVKYKGGKCEKCGYDKCIDALEFHHIDSSTKSFGIGNGDIRSLKRLKEEADKCIMVCSNCHKEIHAELRAKELDEKMEQYEKNRQKFVKNKESMNIHVYNHPKEKDIVEIKSLLEMGKSKREIAKDMNFALTTLKRFILKYKL